VAPDQTVCEKWCLTPIVHDPNSAPTPRILLRCALLTKREEGRHRLGLTPRKSRQLVGAGLRPVSDPPILKDVAAEQWPLAHRDLRDFARVHAVIDAFR